jgi:hypothetical protein
MGAKNPSLAEHARHWNQDRGVEKAQQLVAG